MSEDWRRWTSQIWQSKFALPPPFCSIWAMNILDDTHLFGKGLLIQTLISSGNALTDTPRNNVLLAIWVSLS